LALQNSDTVRTYNTISGTTGADTLTGGANFDYIFADYGNDTLYGGAGNDRLDGAWDNDTLYGQDGNDVLEAGSGNDTLYGGDGNDTMIGENGNDIFYGGAGADTITTGNNSDIIVLDDTTFSGVDTIQDFSSSNDKIIIANLFPYYDPWIHTITDYVQITDSGSNSILKVDIDGGGNSFVQVATIIGVTGLTNELALQNSDTVRTYNTISGTTGADTLTGGANFDYIFADYGNDTLYGGAGNDRLDGAWDNDTLYGQDGNDVLEAGSGNDTLYGGDGNDTMIGENGNDIFYGGAGADTITTGNNSDIIVLDDTTFSGVDTIQDFSSSNDKIIIANLFPYYDPWIHNITHYVQIVDSGSNSILSVDIDGGGNSFVQVATIIGVTGLTNELALQNSDTVRTYNTISGTTGADTLTGGANFDYIFADYGNDTLYGGAGNDRLDGAWDNDTLYGQDGNDVLEAGSGNDTLYGGDGNDTMIGENGNDIFYGGAGADTITTGNNSDIIVFDSTAFSGIDTVQDFNSSSDKIDIADVLVGYDALTEAITDFVQITTSGSNSILSVDADGGANNFVQIATLVGITGLTDEEALETAGKLITV
jgi:Ca2+-binding RTX toxin-like protein